MRYWQTLFLLNGIIISGVLLGTQVWAGEKLTRGSSWEIVGTIELPPRKASIYFQDGRPTAAISCNQYAPWCNLVFNSRGKQKRTLNKGVLEITKVSYDDEAINGTTTSYKTTMALKPTEVPDITQIVCGIWGDNSDNYLTIKEIRQVMAGVMKLELKTGK